MTDWLIISGYLIVIMAVLLAGAILIGHALRDLDRDNRDDR